MRIWYPHDPKAPTGAAQFRLEQLEAIERIRREVVEPDRSHAVLVGAGMGSGKTVVSVEVMLETKPNRCLVVGVKDSYSQWAKTLREQQDVPIRQLLRIDASIPGRDNMLKLMDGDDGWFFIGLEMLRAQDWETVSETWTLDPEIAKLFGPGIATTGTRDVQTQKHVYKNMPVLDLLISDESHKHANQKSASLDTVRELPCRAKIALSGTFFGNKFENAWSVCIWLWGKPVIGPKYRFQENYCIVEPVMSKDGRKQLKTKGGFPLTKIAGEKNPGEFVETLPCYVFIPTPIGPVPDPELVYVDLTTEQLRQYEEMEEQSLTWIPSSRLVAGHEPLVADIPLAQRGRLRTAALGSMTLVPNPDPTKSDQIRFDPGCDSSTLNKAYDVLHRPSWVGKKALILTHSREFALEVARRIEKKYPGAVFLKTGTTKKWEAMKDSFMAPVSETGRQFLVAVISAVGTATDGLQANCAKVLWLSEDDNDINNVQGSNRVWRDGVDLADYEGVKIVQRGTIAEGVLRKNLAHKERTLTSVRGTK